MAEGYVIGVDLGGTKLLAGAVGADLSVIHRTNRPVYGLSQDELVQMVADAVEEIRVAVGGEIEGIGFGIPCTFDSRTGMAVQAVNVPLKDVAFGEVMAARLGAPVVVDNDANCHTVCESRLGIAQGATDVALLTLGTGIGGGLILGGRPYRGSRGAAAELGHFVVDMDGPPCPGRCPNNGCIESLVSGTALRIEAERAIAANPGSPLAAAAEAGGKIDGTVVTGLARAGDEISIRLLETMGRRLGVALTGLANVFDPDVMVIGGGVIDAGELLLGPAREEFERRALTPQRETPIKAAELGADAGMIGASILGLEELAASGTAA